MRDEGEHKADGEAVEVGASRGRDAEGVSPFTVRHAQPGDAAALVALRRHARTFPKGQLAEERELLLVRALRASGDDEGAGRRAQEFKQRFPNSLQRGARDAGGPTK